jgi:Holliday junction resolvase
MSLNKGKQFEQKLREDFIRSFPFGTIDRINDSMTGYRTISNISDFVAYNYPLLYYIECKSHNGNTFPLVNLTQYDKLMRKVGIKGVRAGVVLWMIEHDKVLYLPISFIKYLKENDYKSFNIKMLKDENLNKMFIDIPSIKVRVFMKSDYSILSSLPENW